MEDSELREADSLIDLALAEDLGQGDVTTETLIPPTLVGRAEIVSKAEGVLAGVEVVRRVFGKIDASVEVRLLVEDGARVQPGDIVACISGRVASILKGERVALNFLSRLSGVASLTAEFVACVSGLPVKIADTRKTTPGFRLLQKYAVRMGGGYNHRRHLGEMILIKDNHLAALRALDMSLGEIVAGARAKAPAGVRIEVEVTSVAEALLVVAGGADMILLDNMSPEAMREARNAVPGRVKLEASGGINLANVREVALAGVDIISIGALTHSAPALDYSLELNPGSVSGTGGKRCP